MDEHKIHFNYNARYYTLGKLSSHTKEVWVVLHGYGQLAKFFLKKFQSLSSDECFIVAPEGLSKFYQEGFSGRVGSTWMTKENRLSEIENYINYLNSIYANFDLQRFNVNVLGFSQGVATASRWVLSRDSIKVDRLYLWAGSFPEDIDIKQATTKLQTIETHLIYGLDDPLVRFEDVQKQEHLLNQIGCYPKLSNYAAGHDIDIEHLKKIINYASR